MNLPSLDSFLVSEAFAIDMVSGRLSVFNMVDSLFVPSLPALWPRFVAIAVYDAGAEPVSFDDRVSVQGPNGPPMGESINRVEVLERRPEEPSTTRRSVHVIWRTQLASAGDLYVVLERRPDASSPWEVVQRKRIALSIGPHPLHGPGSAAPPASIPPAPQQS